MKTFEWKPIDTAPLENVQILLGCFVFGALIWAEAGRRGKAPLSKLWFTPTGKSIARPTHWMNLP